MTGDTRDVERYRAWFRGQGGNCGSSGTRRGGGNADPR